jgi:hypothetical protein
MPEVFISYAHDDNILDERWVAEFGRRLEQNLRAQGLRDLTVFTDHKINPLVPWERVIREKAEDADILVVIKSPNYFYSDWCKIELKSYWDKSRQMSEARIAVVEAVRVRDKMWSYIERQLDKKRQLPARFVNETLSRFTPIKFYTCDECGREILLFISDKHGAEYCARIWDLAVNITDAYLNAWDKQQGRRKRTQRINAIVDPDESQDAA